MTEAKVRRELEKIDRQLAGARHQLRQIAAQRDSLAGVAMQQALRQKADHLNRQIAELEANKRDLIEQAAEPVRLLELSQRAYWFQRLNTSMAIAHGAGFAAVSAHLFDPATRPADVAVSLPAMAAFGLGAIVAGAIPWPLAHDMKRLASWLTRFAAGLFVLAIALALGGAGLKAMS